MNLSSRVEKETLHRFLIFGAPAAALSALATILDYVGFFSDLLAGVDGQHRPFYTGALVVIFFLISVCLSVSWFAIDQKRRREAELRDLSQSYEDSMKSLNEELLASRERWVHATKAIDKIISKTYNLDETRWKFTEVHETYTVLANGTTRVERTHLVEVGDKPALIWKIDINPDGSADPIISLQQIDFQISVSGAQNGESIEYILYDDRPNEKRIAAFFLPEIVSGERRKVNLSYTWPGFARDLVIAGQTDFEFCYRTCEPTDVADVKIELRFAIALGQVNVEQISPHIDGDSILRTDTPGFQVFRYSNAKLPMDHRELRLRAKVAHERV